MKEILKYLRNLHSYSQTDVSEKIGISRQTYYKYESGVSEPSEKIVQKLADLYNVESDFILKNQIPPLPEKKEDLYTKAHRDFNKKSSDKTLAVADSGAAVAEEVYAGKYHLPFWGRRKSYDAYFDGNALRVLDGAESSFKKGQKFKLVDVSEEEELEKKKRALERIQRIIAEKPFKEPSEKDPYYKEALYEALMEKYGNNTN